MVSRNDEPERTILSPNTPPNPFSTRLRHAWFRDLSVVTCAIVSMVELIQNPIKQENPCPRGCAKASYESTKADWLSESSHGLQKHDNTARGLPIRWFKNK